MRRALPILLAGGVLAGALALPVPADAGYKARVSGGTLTLTGNAKGDRLALRLKRGAPGILQVDVGANGSTELSFRRSRFGVIVVNAGGGDDVVTIVERYGAFTTTELTRLNGGSGNDRLTGGSGGETLDGGSGKDTLRGQGGADTVRGRQGPDTVSLGAGDDTAVSALGDGNDSVSGGSGTDLLRMSGTTGGDALEAHADGAAAVVTRNVDGARVSAVVERLALDAGAGLDDVTVADLAGTGITQVDVDLGVAGTGDGADDRVFVEGTNGNDIFGATAVSTTIEVTGLAAQVNVVASEPVFDRLTLAGLAGSDSITGGPLAALAVVTLDGGEGADTLSGGNGGELLAGGVGADLIDGNQGGDTVFGGDGDDVVVWDPGDGSDLIEGQAGSDTLRFNGSAGAEIFAASANGGRFLFTRNVGNIVMDVDDVETLALNALAGTDSVTVNDLSATDVDGVTLDLGAAGLGDAAADAVVVNGTGGADALTLSGGAGSFTLRSGAFVLSGLRAEPANDTLTVNLGSGDDLLGASGLASSSVMLAANGGNGNDVLVGSTGNDALNGDANDDFLDGNDGNDTLDCGANVDIADGGSGIDSQAGCETVVNVP